MISATRAGVERPIAVAWCFEDEATPDPDAPLDRLAEGSAEVPAHWPLEVGDRSQARLLLAIS